MSNLCKIGKVFRIKTQTCLSVASFCGLGKRERFLVEEIQPALAIFDNLRNKKICRPLSSQTAGGTNHKYKYN